jgi:hypothetical protein
MKKAASKRNRHTGHINAMVKNILEKGKPVKHLKTGHYVRIGNGPIVRAYHENT